MTWQVLSGQLLIGGLPWAAKEANVLAGVRDSLS